MSRVPRFATCLLLVLSTLAAGCGGGGGSSSSDTAAIEVGLVSGTEPTRKTVTLRNPRDAAATVSALGAVFRMRFDAATLPTAPVPAGGTFTCDLVLTPIGPGAFTDQLGLLFRVGGDEGVAVLYSVTGATEQVVLEATPAVLEFGAPPFGGQADRALQLRNRSTVSTVTYTSASLPPDVRVVSPALPCPVAPGEAVSFTLRWSPWTSMAPRDTTATLNAASTAGSLSFQVRGQPAPGTVVVDYGYRLITDGLGELLTVDVPAPVWALQVEAWIEGAEVPEGVHSGLILSELMSLATFERPDGTDCSQGWHPAPGAFAACLPRGTGTANRIQPGGGTYRFRFRMEDTAGDAVPVRVRAHLKGAAQPVAAGLIDLNLWVEPGLGVTAATAPTDAYLQGVLARTDQILAQIGLAIGNVDYYDFDMTAGFNDGIAMEIAIRDALTNLPAGVKERLNLFLGPHASGYGGRLPGCATARSNHSFAHAGSNVPATLFEIVIAHEILHHLGLWHLGTGPAVGVGPNGIPRNVMEPVAPIGTFLSPGQGEVARAHPFVR